MFVEYFTAKSTDTLQAQADGGEVTGVLLSKRGLQH